MPATKEDTWDIEMDHFRCDLKRYAYKGTVKARRVQRRRPSGEWTDWLYHRQLVDADLEADTKPHLRKAAEAYNRAAGRMINRKRLSRAVRERKRLLREQRRTKARERFAEICDEKWGGLGMTYHRSRDRYDTTGGPDAYKRERSFVEWLSIWLPEHRPEEATDFHETWARVRKRHDLPEDTHFV